MPNPIETLRYIKCHCYISSLRPIKSPSKSIRYNCQKIWSWSRRPETTMEIRKEATSLVVFNNSIIKITIHSWTSNRAVVFSSRIPPPFLNTGPQIRLSKKVLHLGCCSSPRSASDLDPFRHIWESLAEIFKKFRLTVLQTYYWNRIRTRHFWRIKAFRNLTLTKQLCIY